MYLQKEIIRKEVDSAVIKFVGDSGDGMQLAGTLFSEVAVKSGNDLATFPDFPAEIRAPHNTVAGVSGYQVRIGQTQVHTVGDYCDVLMAMNPASLRANLKWTRPGSIIVTDSDAYDERAISKAGYSVNPLEDESLEPYYVVKAPIGSLLKEALAVTGIDPKSADKSRNMFALGFVLNLYDKDPFLAQSLVSKKFSKKPAVAEANIKALMAGYQYADMAPDLPAKFSVPPARMKPGSYRNITGNVATAWGLMAAAERSGRPLFLGSYPITPATDIMNELARYKSLGNKVFQAEDEIAGICSAIGASFTGSLAVTTTSGPGFSLKSEAMGLAVMTELPLVIVDVQRGGPSTGMPTKSEQADLYQALFGRNGECPMVVMAASSPADCFYAAFKAAKIAMEHMTPVILLTDGYIGNGTQLFKIPEMKSLPEIHPPIAQAGDTDYKPFKRNPETLARQWALPGTAGLRHRVGGLEKTNIDGIVSTDPLNHELMVNLREEKIQKVSDYIDKQELIGEAGGDLLVVSWGGTYGSVLSSVQVLQNQGSRISLMHFNHILPLPSNTTNLFAGFKKILVCELNSGQFVNYLRMVLPMFRYEQFNKVQGLPFKEIELINKFNQMLEHE